MKIACCGEHTTRSAHPEFTPEFPERLAKLCNAATQKSSSDVEVKNFGFPTAVVCKRNAPDVDGGKAKQYLDTNEAQACEKWQPDVIILGPFGKHDALGQYPPPADGVRYDSPATFTAEEFYDELKQLVQWAQGLGADVVIATPIPFPFGSTKHTCARLVQPATKKLAEDLHLAVLDLYPAFAGRKEAFTDADHLQDKEIDLMAKLAARSLLDARSKL